MDSDRPDVAKSGRTFDSAYSFSFSIAIGLVLFIAGLVISLTLGQGATIGLIFGIPLLIAGLVLPVTRGEAFPFHHKVCQTTYDRHHHEHTTCHWVVFRDHPIRSTLQEFVD